MDPLGFFPHLRLRRSGERLGFTLAKHSLDSFKVFRIGTLTEKAKYRCGKDQQTQHYEAFRDRLVRVLRVRHGHATSGTAVMSEWSASWFEEMGADGVEDAADKTLNGMPGNIAAVLGRRPFTRKDIDDMPRLPARALKGGAVYIAFIIKSDGRIVPYMGSTVARSGGGNRLISQYEKAQRWAKRGVFTTRLQGSFMAEASASDTMELHLRAFHIEELPPLDDAEA